MNTKKLNKKVNMAIRYEIYNYFYIKNIDEIIKHTVFGVFSKWKHIIEPIYQS